MKFNSFNCKNKIENPKTIFNYTVLDLDNKKISLEKFRINNPILVVNVASL